MKASNFDRIKPHLDAIRKIAIEDENIAFMIAVMQKDETDNTFSMTGGVYGDKVLSLKGLRSLVEADNEIQDLFYMAIQNGFFVDERGLDK